MLRELHIKNIAVIDEARIEFEKGFNSLTGETGAGKSILIDSINMLLGNKTPKDLIRTGEEKAVVNGIFDIDEKLAEKIADDLGVDVEDNELYVSRQINTEGKNVCRINGMTCPVAQLKEIGTYLIDIHGQSDNQALLNPKFHIDYLDSFAGNSDVLSEYTKEYKEVKRIKKEIDEIKKNRDDAEYRLEILEFQINEIETARLIVGEDEELEERRNFLRNAEKIMSAAESAHEYLYSGNGTQLSSFDLLMKGEKQLSDVSEYDKELGELYERMTSVRVELEDITATLSDYISKSNYEAGELDAIEERLDTINTLKRKYGGSIETVLEKLEELKKENTNITDGEEILAELKKELERHQTVMRKMGELLSERRRKASDDLERKIMTELSELDMPKIRFSVSVTADTDDEGVRYTSTGGDVIEFLISTNPGESLKPMNKIASGGELSRIMLAMKSVFAGKDMVDTLIFDEIDTGVSGRAAEKIAEKICRLSMEKQVLCVTHLPQITAMADTNFLIEKDTEGERTKTSVIKLDTEGKTEEVARIIGGVTVTELTKQSAFEMIKQAEEYKKGIR